VPILTHWALDSYVVRLTASQKLHQLDVPRRAVKSVGRLCLLKPARCSVIEAAGSAQESMFT